MPVFSGEDLTKSAKLLTTAALVVADPTGITAGTAGLDAVLHFYDVKSNKHTDLKKLEKETSRNLKARFKTPTFHCPQGAEIHLPQMIAAGLSTPADYIDCNLNAAKIIERMITRFKEPEHRAPEMIEAYRCLCLPVLSGVMDDPRMLAILDPLIKRKQLDQLTTISEKLDNLPALPRDDLELLASRFEIAAPHDLSEADLLGLLKLKAEEYRGLKVAIGELAQNLPQLGNVMAEALAQLEQGNAGAVRQMIADARQTLRDATLQQSLEQDADLVAVDARALILMGELQAAHDVLSAAADSFASLDPLEPARRRNVYYEQLYDHGLRYGGAGLGLAAGMLRVALGTVSEEDAPELWASLQNNLANALGDQATRLGGEDGQTLMAEAVQAYRDALRVYTEAAHPVHWAMTQENLAILHEQSVGFDGADVRGCLGTALQHVDRALRVFDAETMPYNHGKASELKKRIEGALAGL